ncbi:DegT/DnrJ/EryC1/StrS family aminotransferase [Janibacter anophelis]|uniref:DegT/DnrJ/EryC1/StrS family aminotransferase n=1 Tax=Janibacter anophelis TaxID=319054 RepID=UPI003F804A20
MTDRIHLSKAEIGPVEEGFVLSALRSGWIAPLGPDVDAFEGEIAQRCGVAHALALSSGTAALQLALLEVGAGPGTIVLCPTMTFAATANAITYTGAEPYFIDALPEDANIDVDVLIRTVDELQAAGESVVAVVPVDLYGRCADYASLVPAMDSRGVAVVEDAAEALGASRGGRPAGSFGRAAALSFNGNKILTTSGGGMLLSDDAALVAHARKLSTQAREPRPWYEHTETGYNYRLSNILAALGRGQLTRLDEMIQRRRDIRAHYRTAMSGLPIRFLPDGDAGPDDSGDNCWLTTIEVLTDAPDIDGLVATLDAQEIEARHVWKPMHLQPLFAKARASLTGAADDLFRRGLNLPSGANLTDEQVDRVAVALRAAVETTA